jgi:D-alanyl-D-alanine carboxypeptidase (penicillin-binding protein 5/6)
MFTGLVRSSRWGLLVFVIGGFIVAAALFAPAQLAPSAAVEDEAVLAIEPPIVVEESSLTTAAAPAIPELTAAEEALINPAPAAWAAPPVRRSSAVREPETQALAALVLDEASGAVLYDRNGYQALPPASLTKIATLILALEADSLDDEVTVDVDSRTMRGSTVMGLQPGDRFRLRDLLYGLMLPSGNDAALAIGRHLAGSDVAFVERMNHLLARLQLTTSHFLNPHGLGGGEHATSAYDLAVLSRYGMSLPGFREIVTARSWTARGSRTIQLGNINTFLTSYTGADGIKTGYTRRAGQTLAAAATRNGHRLYAIVLNSSARDADARRLLDWAFASYVWPQ